MNLSDTAATIKNVWDLFSDAHEIANKTENLDLQRKLNELQQQIIFLERELNEKDRILLEYEKKEDLEKSFVFQNNAYWKKDDNGNLEGPFCPSCKDGEEKSVRMSKSDYFYRCPVCQHAQRHTKQSNAKHLYGY